MNWPAEKSRTGQDKVTVRRRRQKAGVLVVNNEYRVRIVLQLALERNGFDVWLASDGEEALEVYRKFGEGIEVVLLDECKPVPDGLSTLDALRELDPDVRACFISWRTSDRKPEELIERRVAYVFTKPFDLDQLVDILRLLTQNAPAELHGSGEGWLG
jgi:DNA-binding response OmpR family regulator